MAKKIGIVSLYIGRNFGNKLQNYAVEKIIEEYGFEPRTLKYEVDKAKPVVQVSLGKKFRPAYIMTALKVRLSRLLPMKNSDSGFLKKLAWLPRQSVLRDAKARQMSAYRRFDENYLHFADHVIGLEEKDEHWTEDYAFFFCGSDQVWNPYYQSTNRNCFLQFAPREKRVAFAPSFGVSAIPEERKPDIAAWLSDIPYLSVREEAGRDIIRELTGREAEMLVDPTMMLTREQWDEFAEKPAFTLPEKYIVTYFLGDRTREYSAIVNENARRLGVPVVHLLDLMQPEYYVCNPNEFVYCIKNAEMVFTDSFHASVFSILYQKQFQVFERVEGDRKMSSRLETLLTSFGLKERMFRGISRIPEKITDEAWCETERHLVLEREKAKRFVDRIVM